MRQAVMIKSTFDSYDVPKFVIVHLVETEDHGCIFYQTETNNTDYLSNGWATYNEEYPEAFNFDKEISNFKNIGFILYILDNAS
jgi:hypothetical protein